MTVAIAERSYFGRLKTLEVIPVGESSSVIIDSAAGPILLLALSVLEDGKLEVTKPKPEGFENDIKTYTEEEINDAKIRLPRTSLLRRKPQVVSIDLQKDTFK